MAWREPPGLPRTIVVRSLPCGAGTAVVAGICSARSAPTCIRRRSMFGYAAAKHAARRDGAQLPAAPGLQWAAGAGREQIGVGPRQAAAARHYTLSDEDLQNIGAKRRPRSKLGFALQLSRSTSQPSRRRTARAGVQHRLETSVREPATSLAAAAGATSPPAARPGCASRTTSSSTATVGCPPGPVGDRLGRGGLCVRLRSRSGLGRRHGQLS